MKKFLKVFAIICVLLALVAAIWGYPTYQALFGKNVSNSLSQEYLHIPTGASYDEIVNILQEGNYVEDISAFKRAASIMKFDQRKKMRSGRFQIQPNMTNRELIQLLRAGKQSPVKVTISYGRIPQDVAGKAAQYIEADSLGILTVLTNNDLMKQHGTNRENALTHIIPNTYEFFWNTDETGFWKRMVKEHKAFWTKERLAKAKKLNLTPEEVYTLASIVEGETNYKPEKPRVAGVYLNRLRIGMLLQADPTIKFAMQNFELKRILNVHKDYDSPYNTYMYKGLPPGPIMLASISSIDAVLNPEKHDYLFFCAKPPSNPNEKPNQHAFARTLAQHNANARRYHAYLNKIGIR